MKREVYIPYLDKRRKPLRTEYSKAIHDRVDKLLNRNPHEIDMEAFDKNTKRFIKLNSQAREMLDKLGKE
jgi:hypothetical protein